MISANLVFLRNSHNFSQEEVAEKIGVSRQAVERFTIFLVGVKKHLKLLRNKLVR